jgi:hypothetical protein
VPIEEARKDGKLVKVPIPKNVRSQGRDYPVSIEDSTYVKVFREQSEEIQRKRGTLDNSEQSQ